MAAAAYAKDLLSRIPPSMVKEEEKLSDLLSKQLGLQEKAHDVQKAQHDIAQEQLELQKEAIRRKDCNEEKECLRVFRLTDASKDATYEWYKDRVDDRVDGTCEWFLGHDNFQLWLAQESGPLIVSADPGCGKSVLAKYLIDAVLRESATVCYFFFKHGDQTLAQQALCALLHQLFTQKPLLINHAMEAFRKDGQMLVRSKECLWDILESAVGDPDAGPIIFILDALDECDDLEFENLARRIDSQFSSKLARFSRGLDKYAPAVRIPGEEESEAISREVNHVIAHRVQNLPGDIPQHIRAHLQQKLQEMSHRTYLWVYLVFDQLEKEGFMMTLSGVEDTLATLPKTVDEAYEKILSKSKEHPMVLKTLSIILAAHRPLTLSEMNIAVHIDKTWTPKRSLEDDEHFAARLRSWIVNIDL
ncbi:Ankyrin repeat A protein 2 [Lecanicillium sp. MT-2017a]|nr:Ankyrin repeat A protein 2 [Lecanicillium sp. MT-2017a]